MLNVSFHKDIHLSFHLGEEYIFIKVELLPEIYAVDSGHDDLCQPKKPCKLFPPYEKGRTTGFQCI